MTVATIPNTYDAYVAWLLDGDKGATVTLTPHPSEDITELKKGIRKAGKTRNMNLRVWDKDGIVHFNWPLAANPLERIRKKGYSQRMTDNNDPHPCVAQKCKNLVTGKRFDALYCSLKCQRRESQRRHRARLPKVAETKVA